MQDLTPVGLSKDGSKLLLISTSGEEFAVPVDTRLRAALRGDNARLGQLEMKMESALRPRDIQARIRAGESPEDVATAAQTTVDAIMGFATPVLAERAHVAAIAQKASVRRRSGESSPAGRTLGDLAEAYFSSLSVFERDVTWDAWRRSDGKWALVAEYAVSGRPRRAEFTHDLPGRFVVADNDEARTLTGELAAPAERGQAAAPGRRLSSVPASQDELPLGDDAIELVRDQPASPLPVSPSAPETTPSEQAEAAAAAYHGDPAGVADRADLDALGDLGPTADADWLAPDRPTPPPRPARAPEPAEPASGSAESAESAESAGDAARPAEAPAPKKKGRASVPSWDEIMFGGGKGD